MREDAFAPGPEHDAAAYGQLLEHPQHGRGCGLFCLFGIASADLPGTAHGRRFGGQDQRQAELREGVRNYGQSPYESVALQLVLALPLPLAELSRPQLHLVNTAEADRCSHEISKQRMRAAGPGTKFGVEL